MKKEIKWSSDDDANSSSTNINPWERPKSDSFNDLILKEEFRSRRMQFDLGQTWLRIVPAFASSPFGWMLGVHALKAPGAIFPHPRTLKSNARSAYDHAYAWLKENDPTALFSKNNRDGIRLLADPVSLFWALVEKNGRYEAKLVQASGYDGSRGGVAGFGHQIFALTKRIDETGELMSEPVHPERGVLISVTKTKPHGAQYPTYGLTVGRQPAPMSAILEKTDPTEFEAIRPLEEVVNLVSEEDEWEFLSQVLKPHHVDGLRASLSK